MSDRRHTARGGTTQFRRRLFITMTLVVLMVTVIAIFLVQRRMEADVRWNLGRRFEGEFNALIAVQNATRSDQMAAAIKQLSPATPVILLTGFGHFLDKAELPGIDILLSKPIGIGQLREALTQAVCAA